MLLPVAQQVTTAVAFHPVDNADTASFSPVGDRLGGGDLGQKLADIFAGGGGMQYYLMAGDGGDQSSSTAGLDVGAVPGSPVVSPVDGKVTAIKKYSILGRYSDVEIDIRLASDPSLLLVVTHIADAQGRDRRGGAARHDHAGRRARLPRLARPGAEPVHVRQRRSRPADDVARHARPGRAVSAVVSRPRRDARRHRRVRVPGRRFPRRPSSRRRVSWRPVSCSRRPGATARPSRSSSSAGSAPCTARCTAGARGSRGAARRARSSACCTAPASSASSRTPASAASTTCSTPATSSSSTTSST